MKALETEGLVPFFHTPPPLGANPLIKTVWRENWHYRQFPQISGSKTISLIKHWFRA